MNNKLLLVEVMELEKRRCNAIYGLMRLTNAIYCTGIKTD